MTNFSVRGAPASAHSSASPKVLRADIVEIRGTAEHCPQVFARVLDRVLIHGVLPVAITVERRSRSIRFAIQTDDLAPSTAVHLVQRLQTIPMVRTVRLRKGGSMWTKRRERRARSVDLMVKS